MYASATSFGLSLLVAATLAMVVGHTLPHKDLHLIRSTKLAWRTNGLRNSRASARKAWISRKSVLQERPILSAPAGAVGYMPCWRLYIRSSSLLFGFSTFRRGAESSCNLEIVFRLLQMMHVAALLKHDHLRSWYET